MQSDAFTLDFWSCSACNKTATYSRYSRCVVTKGRQCSDSSYAAIQSVQAQQTKTVHRRGQAEAIPVTHIPEKLYMSNATISIRSMMAMGLEWKIICNHKQSVADARLVYADHSQDSAAEASAHM